MVNNLYEWSQNFVTRELTGLNEMGVEMLICARAMRQRQDLTPSEARLAERFHQVPEVPFFPSHLGQHLRVVMGSPARYFSAWAALFSLRHKPSKFFRGVVCLFRAATLVREVKARNINLIHAHFLTAAGETALYLSKMTGVPFGATAYAMDIFVDNSGLPGKLRHAAYVNGTTLFNERFMAQLVPENPGKIVTRYYGIPTSPQLPAPLPHERFTFIAVGRLVEKKGFRYLLEACAMLREEGFDFNCNIIGKGPLEAELQAQARALGLEGCVRFIGFVPPNEMKDTYRRGDILAAPCVVAANGDVDGLPNVCLEAMDCGLPVISTTISGIPEGVEHGANGWLIPPNDSAALAEAMRSAMRSPNLAEMRSASHQMVATKFDVRKNVRPVKELMERHAI